MYKLM